MDTRSSKAYAQRGQASSSEDNVPNLVLEVCFSFSILIALPELCSKLVLIAVGK